MRGMRLTTVVVAAVVLAGCSSNSTPSEESSTQAPAPAPSEHGSYAGCLQEHGVSAPPGPVAGPPPGVDEATWKQAEKACASLAPGPDAP